MPRGKPKNRKLSLPDFARLFGHRLVWFAGWHRRLAGVVMKRGNAGDRTEVIKGVRLRGNSGDPAQRLFQGRRGNRIQGSGPPRGWCRRAGDLPHAGFAAGSLTVNNHAWPVTRTTRRNALLPARPKAERKLMTLQSRGSPLKAGANGRRPGTRQAGRCKPSEGRSDRRKCERREPRSVIREGFDSILHRKTLSRGKRGYRDSHICSHEPSRKLPATRRAAIARQYRHNQVPMLNQQPKPRPEGQAPYQRRSGW